MTSSGCSSTSPTPRPCAPLTFRSSRTPGRPSTRSATSPTTSPSGATTTTKRALAATTAAGPVERGQHAGTCAAGSEDPAEGQLVAPPAGDLRRAVPVRCLRDVPGVPGRVLLLRALPLTVLFTLPDHRLRTRVQ